MNIPLTRGLFAAIDDSDSSLIAQFNWLAIGVAGKEYAARNAPCILGVRKPPIYMHRVIVNAPDGMVVDHINGDRLDNRRVNLRICTHRQNIAASRSATGSSAFKGVTFDRSRGKWIAQIRINYEHKQLGRFKTERGAAAAYDAAAIAAWGEFATTNFPITKAEAEAH